MTRIAAFFGRAVGWFAALACALDLATARVMPANGAAAPGAHVDCAPPGAGSPAATVVQRPRIAVRPRSLSGVTGAALRTPAPTRSPGRAGLVVEVDPLVGEASSTVAGADRSPHPDADAFTRSTDGLELRINPDGSRRVDLQGRFRAYSVLIIAADGTLTMACADDQASALGLARAAAPRSPADRAQRPMFGPREE